MYKIHRLLLLLTLSASFTLFGQQAQNRPISDRILLKAGNLQANPRVRHFDKSEVQKSATAYLSSDPQNSRKAVFIAHLFVNPVESQKKHAYDALIGGQKANLPYPTQFQIPGL